MRFDSQNPDGLSLSLSCTAAELLNGGLYLLRTGFGGTSSSPLPQATAGGPRH
jgi:hypothetical protein